MTDFVIFYEHRARELESVCLLKEELCGRGYRVRVANTLFWRAFSTFLFYRPKVLVVPWLYGDREVAFFNRFPVQMGKIVNLQCEQIHSLYARKNPKTYPSGYARKAFHVCWGERQKAYLEEAGIPAEKLLLTGSISMDMNRSGFHSFFLSRQELAQKYKLDETCPWNLFISSFSYVGLSDERLHEIEEMFPLAFQLADISRRTRNALLKWFEQYAVTHPDTIFIYRPHPAEQQDGRLREMEEQFGNFKVISEESVRQWIFCCDRINNWYSTSINDVCFLGKNSSTLRPVEMPPLMENEELKEEKFLTTYEEFEKFNEKGGKETSRELRKVVQRYCQHDEIPAYVKLADCLEKIRNSRCEEDFSPSKSSLHIDPFWKRLRMACFVWISVYIPAVTDLICSGRRKGYAESIRKECAGIHAEYKKTSRKIRRILREEKKKR